MVMTAVSLMLTRPSRADGSECKDAVGASRRGFRGNRGCVCTSGGTIMWGERYVSEATRDTTAARYKAWDDGGSLDAS